MRHFRTRLDHLRQASSALENHVADEVLQGRMGRRAFLVHGSALGLSAPFMAAVLDAAGLPLVGRARAEGKPGATIRIAQITPAGAIDPVTCADIGTLCILHQTADFLVDDGPDLKLRPSLATAWKPNQDGTEWTFTLRSGVKFHDGRLLTADDVVATFDRLADPGNGSNALSAFRGVLSKGGTRKVDDLTVAFHLDAPNGNFPYYVSSDNYNAIILPADYKGDFEKSFIGTGPFRIEKYTPKVGASFTRNPDYWGSSVLPARLEFSFYEDQQPMVLALLGGQVDVVQQIVVQGAQGLLDNPAAKIIRLKSTAHRQLHMRCDTGPFADKRVRQALALTLDRQGIVKGLFRGYSDLGNDSPFSTLYPSTDPGVPQRAKDVAKAKALMAEAGKAGGFETTLTTMQKQELPAYGALIRNAAAEIGIKVNLNLLDAGSYYGKAVFGQSNWLDSEFGMTDYGHRGVPNIFLAAPLTSGGTWNGAHFKNPEYDKLVTTYVAAIDPVAQREAAGKIQRLLLDETPIVFGYFYDYLTAIGPRVSGVEPTAMSQVFLRNAAVAAS